MARSCTCPGTRWPVAPGCRRCKGRAGLHHARAIRVWGLWRGPRSMGAAGAGCAFHPAHPSQPRGTPGTPGRGRDHLPKSVQPTQHPLPIGSRRIRPSPGTPCPKGAAGQFPTSLLPPALCCFGPLCPRVLPVPCRCCWCPARGPGDPRGSSCGCCHPPGLAQRGSGAGSCLQAGLTCSCPWAVCARRRGQGRVVPSCPPIPHAPHVPLPCGSGNGDLPG